MMGIWGSQSSVSGDIVVADLAALMAMPSPADGQAAVVVAPVVGTLLTGGIPRTRWVYISGDGWRLNGGQTLLIDSVPSIGVAGTSAQGLKTYVITPGLFMRLRLFDGYVSFAKSDLIDAATIISWRCGSNGGAGDALFAGTGSFIANARQYFFHTITEFPSKTTARYVGAGVNGFGSGLATTQTYPVNVTTPDQETTPIVMTAAVQMAGSTSVPSVSRVIISGV